MITPDEKSHNALLPPELISVAYFSMEIAVTSKIPTYSGGLGVLAGDHLKAAADMGVPIVGVSLLHRKGYFCQHLDAKGKQKESEENWNPEEFMTALNVIIQIPLYKRQVAIRPWCYLLKGARGLEVPIYFLDTDLEQNDPQDRKLTDHLYGGDSYYRLGQEAVLGMGGALVLRALGHYYLHTYHLNEGHTAFLPLALLRERLQGKRFVQASADDLEYVRSCCVFTTHTPVPAGHDRFAIKEVEEVLGSDLVQGLDHWECCPKKSLNMTFLALRFSRYVNGVAMIHKEVSQNMFPQYPIESITNGVHAVTWTAPSTQSLFDKYIPHWRTQNLNIRYVLNVPLQFIANSHLQAKKALFEAVKKTTGEEFNLQVFTLGFARRATEYKRADLLLQDPDRLIKIAEKVGPMQIIFAGKAHPLDLGGKQIIQKIFATAQKLPEKIRLIYLENYDMDWGKLLCSGVDVWLNTPLRPQEASGTSGMKAALNGVPGLSIMDGWWVEGNVEGVTGWGIGVSPGDEESEVPTKPDDGKDRESLYKKLEEVILPLFYQNPKAFTNIRRSAIAINGPFFNAHRMVLQYIDHSYQFSANQRPFLGTEK